jgi:hypothetical protein
MISEEAREVVRIAESALVPIAHRSGKILYSSARTLRRGSLYILGFNPGGDPAGSDPSHYTVLEALRRLPEKTDNDYVDEVWQGATAPGGRPLQKRMRWLCDQIGQPIETVCAANLIFVRSRTAADAGYPTTADICWPVHQAILAVVQPQLMLTYGSQVYQYILARSRVLPNGVESIPSGHGTWVFRRATIELGGNPIQLVQLPHLSRYDPKRSSQLTEWLTSSLASR